MSPHLGSLPLHKKVSLTLVVVIGVFTVLSFVILRAIISPAFDNVERSASETDLKRVEQALQSNLENLFIVTSDWARWNDIYRYAQGSYPGFEESNLNRPTLTNLDLEFMAIYDVDSDLLWAQVLHDGSHRDLSELGIMNPGHPAASALVRHDEVQSVSLGVIYTELGPAIICSLPILRSDDTGPVMGSLVMGQLLNESRFEQLRERTEVGVSWQFLDEGPTIPDSGLFLTDHVLTDVAEDRITSFKLVQDIVGRPVMVLGAVTDREISALGTQTISGALIFLIVAGIVATAVMWVTLRWTIVSPLERLAGHMEKIRKSGDLMQKLKSQGDDEIAALGRQFDSLTEEVHLARQALLDQSFKAGKADTAAEVLHNIRNAMTPMINGLDRMAKAGSVLEGLHIAEALEQLDDDATTTDRREKLLQYLDASFKHLDQTYIDGRDELNVVTSQARQIESILSDQERFASAAPVIETLPVEDVISEAAHVIPRKANPAVVVDKSNSLGIFSVKAHRIGLLQVLGNLILNAFESIQRGSLGDGNIRVSASEAELDGKPMVRVTVSDNGNGFSQGTGQRLFRRGYSSKEHGSNTGLGLHWCANAVAGMGGRIVAESPGIGQGADFHVLLPAAPGG